MEQPIIDATWVQKSEIGFVFVFLILMTWLIFYVLKTSKAREDKLMAMIMTFQPLLQDVADQLGDFRPVLSEVSVKVGDMDNRLIRIENENLRRKSRQSNSNGGQRKRKADTNGNSREYKPD